MACNEAPELCGCESSNALLEALQAAYSELATKTDVYSVEKICKAAIDLHWESVLAYHATTLEGTTKND
jgi:hypothetical protein